MATDSIAIDQQVAERPGQTAPVPTPAGLQPDTTQTPAAFSGWDKLVAKQGQEPAGWKNLVSDTGHVTMLTPDGSKTGDVPLPNVQKARDAGFHIAVPMTSPDNQKGWVPHSRVADAISSGFKYANDKISAAGDELASLTSLGMLPAFLKTPKGKEINDQFNAEIQDILHNPEKRTQFLVGMVQPGEFGAGALEGATKEAAAALEKGTGFSFSPKTGKAPTDGYMVEVSPESRGKFSGDPVDIQKFVEKNKAILQYKNMHVGGFEGGLEVSLNVPDKDNAVALAKKLDQRSIWDVKNQTEIPTGGTGKTAEFLNYPIHARLADAGVIPAELTTGAHDAAIKAGGAIPGGIQKGDEELGLPDYAMFHDPQSGSSSMLPVDKVTPEAVAKDLEKSRAQYAAAAARAPIGELTTAEVAVGAKRAANNADLERAATQEYGVTDEPKKAGFILQDGRALDFSNGGKVRTLDHGDISEVLPRTGDDAVPYNANPREHFVNQTGAVRLMMVPGGKSAVFAEGSLEHKISDSQLSFLGRAMEDHPTKDLTIDLRNADGIVGSAQGTAEDREGVERIYRDALRDAAKTGPLVTAADRQSPLKRPYEIEVVKYENMSDPERFPATRSTETVSAFSPKDAIAVAKKKFPDADEWNINYFAPAGREAQGPMEYKVPTGQHLSMPPLEGRTSMDTIHHELGHAMVGQNEGMKNWGMVRHTHPDAKGIIAGVLWDPSEIMSAGRVRPDKVLGLVRDFMGGIAQDEIRGLPRNENHNFELHRLRGDGGQAYAILRRAGESHDRAIEIMNQAIDANKEYLTQPAVKSVIEENAPFREPGLSRQFHFSPERLASMHAEVQRRMTNDQGIEAFNNRTANAENPGGRGGNVAGGEGPGTEVAGRGVPAKAAETTPSVISSALLKKVQKSTRPDVTGSTVKLMDNPLPIKGTGEGGAPTTVDVAQALSKYTTSKLKSLELGEANPAQMVKRGAAIAEDEAKYQLAQNNSGEDWYRSDMLKHDQEMQSIRPELEDPTKISLFKWSEAVLSSGHKPYINAKKGLQNWDNYTETGKFSPLNVNYDPNRPISDDNRASWGPRNARSYGMAMESLNRLVAEKGEKGAVDWLLAEHPLSELRQWMSPSQSPVRGKVTDMQPGYMILGAKRGPFGANLHGIETKFTADQWVSRTWNRWMGTIETNPDRPGELTTDSPRNSTERSLMQQSFQAAATKLGKSLSSMQAVLWYYEQALYTAHGVPKESWNFADAAKRVAQEDREAGTFKPEETEEEPQTALSFMKVNVPKGHPILKEK